MKDSFENYAERWLSNKKNILKETSFARYSLIIQNHLIPYFKGIDISEIDSFKVNEFMIFLKNRGNKKTGKGLNSKTISGYIQLLISITQDYRAEYELPYKPIKVKLEKSNEDIVPFLPNEISIIKDYIFIHHTPKNLGIAISLLLGLRIGEVCGLKWGNIDFKQKTISIDSTIYRIYEKNDNEGSSRVIVGSPKTDSSKRVLPMTRTIYELLLVCNANHSPDDYVVTGENTPAEPISYSSYFKRLLHKLGITGSYTFHSLRHTFATNCINSGMDYKSLSKLLGHSSITVTLDLYVHPQMSSMRDQLETMEKCL